MPRCPAIGWERILRTICLGWPWTEILLTASWVDRITGLRRGTQPSWFFFFVHALFPLLSRHAGLACILQQMVFPVLYPTQHTSLVQTPHLLLRWCHIMYQSANSCFPFKMTREIYPRVWIDPLLEHARNVNSTDIFFVGQPCLKKWCIDL
jgi:hypothetical protein